VIKLHHVLLAGALLGLSTVSAQAGFTGSLGVSGSSVTQSPGDLNTSTVFNAVDNLVLSPGTLDFATVPILTSFGATTIDLNVANGFGFSLTNDQWGTFTATDGSIFNNDRPSTLTLAVTGTYVGGSANLGVNTTFAALITFTQVHGPSGPGVLLQQISIDVPAVPEPSSVALGAIGLVSLGLVALRKRRSAN